MRHTNWRRHQHTAREQNGLLTVLSLEISLSAFIQLEKSITDRDMGIGCHGELLDNPFRTHASFSEMAKHLLGRCLGGLIT
jgi:hypothetical protein